MELGRYVVDAVVLEGRSYRNVARAHGVSKSWVAKLVARYRSGGYDAVGAKPKAAKKVANRTGTEVEDRIIRLRKELTEQGFDAGAQTIHYHLSLGEESPPAVATIWRVLRRRGFVTPQPHKRPKSSYIRFEAALPNETWQADVTFFELAVTNSPDVVATLYEAGAAWGLPASVLTDNGCIFTAAYRYGYSALESELFRLGIAYKHSRPYHPQTCGKVERFHQTLKKFLTKQPRAHTIAEVQAQVDRFVAYYNDVRPHRAKKRTTPRAAFDSRDKARPRVVGQNHSRELRIRHDKIDNDGSVTLRYKSKLHHIGMGRALKGTRVILLVAGRDIRVLSSDGQLLRQLTLDPSRDYQPQSKD